MNLDDLLVFAETVKLGSLSRAAQALSLTQPTVTRRIQRLEADFGAELLDRSGARVSPTRAGLAVLTFAHDVLEGQRRLREDLRGLPGIEGDIGVASSSTPSEVLVPNLLAAFKKIQPGVRPHLHVMDSGAVEVCVLQGHCDVGFIGKPPSRGLFLARVVGHDELCLAVPEGHPLSGLEMIDPDGLMALEFVDRDPASGTRITVEERLEHSGIPFASRRIVAEVSSSQALLAAVRSGQGVGFVSRDLFARSGGGMVRALAIRGVDLGRPIYMISRDRPPGAAAQAFIRFVEALPPPVGLPGRGKGRAADPVEGQGRGEGR